MFIKNIGFKYKSAGHQKLHYVNTLKRYFLQGLTVLNIYIYSAYMYTSIYKYVHVYKTYVQKYYVFHCLISSQKESEQAS